MTSAAFRGQRVPVTLDGHRLSGLFEVTSPAMPALLKAGATDLVLRMIEAGTVLPELTLDKPVQAIGEVSRDTTGRSRVRLAKGRQVSALDIHAST